MIELEYAPAFLHQLKKLPAALRKEAIDKVELFKNHSHHRQLKVHKLKGSMRGKLSFSVNYSYRIVFKWLSADVAALLAIGDHDIYR